MFEKQERACSRHRTGKLFIFDIADFFQPDFIRKKIKISSSLPYKFICIDSLQTHSQEFIESFLFLLSVIQCHKNLKKAKNIDIEFPR